MARGLLLKLPVVRAEEAYDDCHQEALKPPITRSGTKDAEMSE